jgi:hypothetical protein
MSLSIDVDEVTAVLLADGWHPVDQKNGVSTFATDAYEIMDWGSQERKDDGRPVARYQPKDSPTGFTFMENGTEVCGPMTSILAVKVKRTD